VVSVLLKRVCMAGLRWFPGVYDHWGISVVWVLVWTTFNQTTQLLHSSGNVISYERVDFRVFFFLICLH
jgi:hypothetical protein